MALAAPRTTTIAGRSNKMFNITFDDIIDYAESSIEMLETQKPATNAVEHAVLVGRIHQLQCMKLFFAERIFDAVRT